MGGRRATVLVAGVLALVLIGAGPAQAVPERLPRIPGTAFLPAPAGLHLGATTRPRLLSNWGAASFCARAFGPMDWSGYCAWQRGSTRRAKVAVDTGLLEFPRQRQSTLVDAVLATFEPQSRLAWSVELATSDPARSRLRTWRTPAGVGIGSTYARFRKVFPKARWIGSSPNNRNRARFTVSELTVRGERYELVALLNRSVADLRRGAKGRVIGLWFGWLGPAAGCKLQSEAATAPGGEPFGLRVRGTCTSGGRAYIAGGLKADPLRVRLSNETRPFPTSLASALEPCSAPLDTCDATKDWRFDLTLGFADAPTKLRLRVLFPTVGRQTSDETELDLDVPLTTSTSR